MWDWMMHLKGVILVVLICEFLKELLSTDSFRKYVQFAIRLVLFLFLLGALFRIDFSLPDFSVDTYEIQEENLLANQYEAEIANQITKELAQNNLSVSRVQVTLTEQYEIGSVTIFSAEDSKKIQDVLKGGFPYEVVYPDQELLDKTPTGAEN